MLTEIKIELNELKHFNEFYSNSLNYINDSIRILSQENTQKGLFFERNEGREMQNNPLKIIRDLKITEMKTNSNYKILIDEVLNKLCIIKDKLIRYKTDLIKNIKIINNDLYNDIENYNNLIKLMLKYQRNLEVSVIKLLKILSQESKQRELLTEKINLIKNRIIRLGDIGKENNLYDTILQEQQIISETNINRNGSIIKNINNYYENNVKSNVNSISNSIADVIEVSIRRNRNNNNNSSNTSTNSNNIVIRNGSNTTNTTNSSFCSINSNSKQVTINQDTNIYNKEKDYDEDDEMKIYEIIDKNIKDNKLLNDYFFPIYYYPFNINNNNIKEQYDNISNINKILEEHENLNLRQQEIKYKCKILSKVLLNRNFSNFDNYNKYINLLYKYDIIRRDLIIKLEEYRNKLINMVLEFKEKIGKLERMYKSLIYSIVRYYYNKHVEYYQIYLELYDDNNISDNNNTDSNIVFRNNNSNYNRINSLTSINSISNMNTNRNANTSINDRDIRNYMIQVINRFGDNKTVNRNINNSNITNNNNRKERVDRWNKGETDRLGICYYIAENRRYLASTTKLQTNINKISNSNNTNRIGNNNNIEIRNLLNNYLEEILSGIEGVFNHIIGVLIESSECDFYDYNYNNTTSGNTSNNTITNNKDNITEVNGIDELMERLRRFKIVFDTDSVYFICLVYGMSKWVCCPEKLIDCENIGMTNGNNNNTTNRSDSNTNNTNSNSSTGSIGNNINNINNTSKISDDNRMIHVLLQSDKYLYSTNESTTSNSNDNNNSNTNISKSYNGSKLVNERYRWIKNTGIMNMKNYVYYKLNLKNEIVFKIKCSLIDKIYLNGVLLLSKDQICFYSYFNSTTLLGKSTYLTIDKSEVIEIKYNGNEIISNNRDNNSNSSFSDIEEEKDEKYMDGNNNTGNYNRNSLISIISTNNCNHYNYDNISLKSYTSANTLSSSFYERNKRLSDKKTITNRLEIVVSRGNVYRFSILYSLNEEVLRFISGFVGHLDREESINDTNSNINNSNMIGRKKSEEIEGERVKEINKIIDNVNRYIRDNKNDSNERDNNNRSSISNTNGIDNQIYNINNNTLISNNNYNISVDRVFNILFNDLDFGENSMGNNANNTNNSNSNTSNNNTSINSNMDKGIKKGENKIKINNEYEELNIMEMNKDNNKDKISLIKSSKILLGSSNFNPSNQYIYNYSNMIGKSNEKYSNTINNTSKNSDDKEEVIMIMEDIYNNNNATNTISNTNNSKGNKNNKINSILVKKNLNYTINDKRILYNNSITEYTQYVFLKDTIIYQSISQLDNLPYNRCFFTLYTIVISGNSSNSTTSNTNNSNRNNTNNNNNIITTTDSGRNSNDNNNSSTNSSNSNIIKGTNYVCKGNINMLSGYKSGRIGVGKNSMEVTNVTIYSEIVFRKKILFNKIVKTEGMNKILYVTRVINNHLSQYATTISSNSCVINNRVENIDSRNKFMLIVVFVIIVMYKVLY